MNNGMLLLLITLLLSSFNLAASGSEPGYLRSPAVYGDRVYFTAEGDLWTAPRLI